MYGTFWFRISEERIMGIILYSTGCPKCNVLKKKLAESNIEYTESNSVKDLLDRGIDEVPVLKVNNEYLLFKQAVDWIRNTKDEHKHKT